MNKLMMGLMLIMSTGVSATVTYPFPLVTGTEMEPHDGKDTITIHVKMSRVQVTDERIPEGATVMEALEILTGQPPVKDFVAGETKHRHGRMLSGMSNWYSYEMQGANQKFTDFMEAWTATALGNASNDAWIYTTDRTDCVTNRVRFANNVNDSFERYYDVSWGLDSVATCVTPHPAMESCSLNTPIVDLITG
ncbi:hypothetical protein NL54_18945 [Pantoea stewartii]|uniref:hypothetical protein n=1 Tax=Pantoea stewartii TaxID=66269 RepID=UPI000541AEDA|nr:hypothetical protein [Pantoea stewartii]KHD99738.1 hypothetical protein NL54_18945 [Pantoea stewartii]KHN59726.1 hypothetical protein OI73_20130 [Pantoea stewartii]